MARKMMQVPDQASRPIVGESLVPATSRPAKTSVLSKVRWFSAGLFLIWAFSFAVGVREPLYSRVLYTLVGVIIGSGVIQGFVEGVRESQKKEDGAA
jgi:hypothetical protein